MIDICEPSGAHVTQEPCPECGSMLRWSTDTGWIPHTSKLHEAMRLRLITHLVRMMHAAAGHEVPLKNWPGYHLIATRRKYW